MKDVVISNFTASINIPSSFDREFCKKEIVEWNLLKKGNMNRSLYFRFIFALIRRFKHCRKFKNLYSSNLCSCSNDNYPPFIHNQNVLIVLILLFSYMTTYTPSILQRCTKKQSITFYTSCQVKCASSYRPKQRKIHY